MVFFLFPSRYSGRRIRCEILFILLFKTLNTEYVSTYCWTVTCVRDTVELPSNWWEQHIVGTTFSWFALELPKMVCGLFLSKYSD